MICKEYLKSCVQNNFAVLATNYYNFETLKGILIAAQISQSKLILQLSENTLKYLGLKPAVYLARSMINDYGVEGWIHLDHGSSIQIIQECLDAGFDSIMIDASEKTIEENIKITQKVVRIA